MKRLIFLLVASAGFWFVSCQSDSPGPTMDTDDVNLETVATAAARFSLEADSVTKHSCKGKLTEVALTDLATAITDFISSTYPSSTLKFAAKDESGKMIVSVLLADGTPKGLIFNADGTFNAELKNHARKAKLTEVAVASLPATITGYITTQYAGAEIKKAGTNAEGQYFVGLILDRKIKVLLFNADGSFNKELEKSANGKGPKRH